MLQAFIFRDFYEVLHLLPSFFNSTLRARKRAFNVYMKKDLIAWIAHFLEVEKITKLEYERLYETTEQIAKNDDDTPHFGRYFYLFDAFFLLSST